MKDIKIIENIITDFDPFSQNYQILILANLLESVQCEKDFIQHTNYSEFFTKAEFASIASSISDLFGFIRIFYSEIEFIKYILENKEKLNTNLTLVFNFARDGVHEGKKSLIPSFCNLYNIKYTGSNPFVISLLRNKFVFTNFLNNLDIPTPITLKYIMGEEFDLAQLRHVNKIIAKNIFEAASVGLTTNNVLENYGENLVTELNMLCSSMQTHELLLQEYIDGIECEVFLVKYKNRYIAFPPIALSIHNSEILTSTISDLYDYSFYSLSDSYSEKICDNICCLTEKIAELLNIENYARLDYRIDKKGNPYLIDIAGTPYLTRNSSVAYLFTKVLMFKYSDIFKLLAALVLQY